VQVERLYSMVMSASDAPVFVDQVTSYKVIPSYLFFSSFLQIFAIFDRDGNGSIDFREFMMATDTTEKGSIEDKLRWAFRMYDKDGSGNS